MLSRIFLSLTFAVSFFTFSHMALANNLYVGAQGLYSAMQEDDVDPAIAYGGKLGYSMNNLNLGLHVMYNPMDTEDMPADSEASDLFAMGSADLFLVEGFFVSGKAGMVNRYSKTVGVEVDEYALAYGGGLGYSFKVNNQVTIDFEANYLVAAETEAEVDILGTPTTVDLEETQYINGGVTVKYLF